jgi:ABC-2 type transport system ATP-binding protein
MIKTEHLGKRYDTLTAVDDVSFEVRPGEVLGFLGPNGAGKSTTMRMLAGFITPTSGKASICGHDVESAPLADLRRNDGLRLPAVHRRPAQAQR